MSAVDEDGRCRPPGEAGELAVSSPWQTLGYHGADGELLRRLPDGSILTGDIGVVDERGFIHLVGRAREMIVTGGENVFPAEVEGVLLDHPAVLEAAVVGTPDDVWGEEVRALVVLRPGQVDADVVVDIHTHCRRRLAGFKAPKVVRAVGSLPYTPLGKLDRAAARREAAQC